MPFPKHPGMYPEEFKKLAEVMLNSDTQEIYIPLSEDKARHLQNQWNAFVRAMTRVVEAKKESEWQTWSNIRHHSMKVTTKRVDGGLLFLSRSAPLEVTALAEQLAKLEAGIEEEAEDLTDLLGVASTSSNPDVLDAVDILGSMDSDELDAALEAEVEDKDIAQRFLEDDTPEC